MLFISFFLYTVIRFVFAFFPSYKPDGTCITVNPNPLKCDREGRPLFMKANICIPVHLIMIIACIGLIVLDLAALLLPAPAIVKLNIP